MKLPKRPSELRLFLLLLLAFGCGPTLRIEPAAGDRVKDVKTIRQEWDDKETIARCEKVVEAYVKAWKAEDPQAAWAVLSPSFRKRWMEASEQLGLDGEKLFAQGLTPSAGMKPWDPVNAVLGPSFFYLAGPAPELNVKPGNGSTLIYAVQEDGGYRAFAFVEKDGRDYIEPALPEDQD